MTGTYQVTGSDGLAGPAKAVRVYSVIVKSDGTAAVVSLRNGTSTGTVYDQIDGTINQAVIHNYEGGLVFPAGCFVDLDAHSTYVTVSLDVIG